MKNKITISICGTEYTIIADEAPEYIHKVASVVDKQMEEIMEKNSHFSISMAAVLTAVNLCDDNHKLQQTADNLRVQLKQYLDDASKARQEGDEARREILRLRTEIQDLKMQLVRAAAQEKRQ
jgi:cell division protein ZapA (FtsZ GTPase activity inhibitor)